MKERIVMGRKGGGDKVYLKRNKGQSNAMDRHRDEETHGQAM